MSARFWSGATVAKLAFGAFLSIVVGLLADVLPRNWPTGGAR